MLIARDLVVGPTHDGGYYLVGAKAAHAALFAGDGTGTDSAFDALLARARRLRLAVSFTERFYDIDVGGDLTQLAAELRVAPTRLPRTAAGEEWQAVESPSETGAGEPGLSRPHRTGCMGWARFCWCR